ncbi:MAG TPA: hypothetical protein VGM06_22685 [Polyangiaceae bacterium]|jgi:protein-S-isoprenylcysteine O-methyltransferase Ste14
MAQRDIPETELRLPKSATSFPLNLVALGVLIAAIVILRAYDHKLAEKQLHLPSVKAMLILMGSLSVPVVLVDLLVLKVHRRPSTGLNWDQSVAPDMARVGTKLLGLLATIAPIAFVYWVFPEYQGSFYDPLYSTLRSNWLALVVIAVTYVWFLDGVMVQPRDAYWQLGRLLLFHPGDVRKAEIANHFRGWLVKAYFFPLMFVWLHNSVHNIINFDLTGADWSNLRVYDFLYTTIFGVDLLFTTAGYALSMKAIDTHIRSAEPTMLGWTVALFCYEPFFSSIFYKQYVNYDGPGFGNTFEHMPTLRWIWAAAIIALIAIYSLATVAFGIRFSNLTHRGILTGGPYRLTKHPAYITKNLSWWLATLPFLQPTLGIAIRHSCGLLFINTIYFLRAKTEEIHLSRDPDYVAYALWMNKHGVLAFIGRWIPALAYKAPVREEPPTLPIAAR